MLLLFAGLAGGIWLDDQWSVAPWSWCLLASASVAIWLCLFHRGFPRVLSTAALFGLVVVVGGLRHHVHDREPAATDLSRSAPSIPAPLAVEGLALTGARIAAPPEPTPLDFAPRRSTTRVLLRVVRVRDGEQWREASGQCWLSVMGELREIGAGDRLLVFGQYSRSTARGNPGEADRSRQGDLDGVGFYVVCESKKQVQILERGSPFSVARWIGFQRQAWIRKLHGAMGVKQGSLAAAILLGAREQLDRPRMDAFLLVGMSHILVVSGANVAIMAGALLWMQRAWGLPRAITFAGIAVFVVWFALLADGDAPVTRAASGMLALLLARFLGRRMDSVQAWSAAGTAVLLLNPAYLFSLGAQLSFLSVATLIEAAAAAPTPRRIRDPLDRLVFRSRPWHVRGLIRLGEILWEALRTSFWVWLVTTPLLWHQFGFLQIGPILLNPVLAIPFAVTLQTGMLFLVVDGWIPGLGPLLGEICQSCLWAMEGVTEGIQSGPSLLRLAPAPPAWWVALFYVSAIGMVATLPVRPLQTPLTIRAPSGARFRRWGVVLLAGCWFVVGGVLGSRPRVAPSSERGKLTITFLSVGHGTCALLEFPGGETWVYDAGNQSQGHDAARILWEALLAARKNQVYRMFISHDDTDHYSGVPALLKRVRVERICWTRDFEPPISPAGKYLFSKVQAAGVLREVVDDQSTWSVEGAGLRILHPSAIERFGSDNSRSIVLEIEYAGRRVLLPGDLETPGLEWVLSREATPYDVVMAPHHGSERSVPERFAGWARPRYVVISGDEEDRRDSTISAFAASGAEVFHTAEVGAVRVEIFEDGELRVSGAK